MLCWYDFLGLGMVQQNHREGFSAGTVLRQDHIQRCLNILCVRSCVSLPELVWFPLTLSITVLHVTNHSGICILPVTISPNISFPRPWIVFQSSILSGPSLPFCSLLSLMLLHSLRECHLGLSSTDSGLGWSGLHSFSGGS